MILTCPLFEENFFKLKPATMLDPNTSQTISFGPVAGISDVSVLDTFITVGVGVSVSS